jgi:hypothetical protein
MPNGHPREVERIRRVSRIWAAVWWLGDVVYYSGFFVLFFGPVSGGGIYYQKSPTLGVFAWRFGLLVLACVACLPIGIVTGLALKALSRRQTGVGIE